MKKTRTLYFTILLALSWIASAFEANAESRIKDISSFEGVRENLLVGYGLVVGLNGTGDEIKVGSPASISITSMLERLGVRIDQAALQTKSVAAVMVTATLPPFARPGSRINIAISTLGNAKSLVGGTLLATPLLGADTEVYAIAQGSVSASGFSAQGNEAKVTKGVPTNGKIPNGAIIEREINFQFNDLTEIRIALTNPDFTTARRVADGINRKFMSLVAHPLDSKTIHVKVPQEFQGKMVDFMTLLEQITVEPDYIAKVVIDDQSGIIVMGDKVRISKVAIAQANLVIEIQENKEVSQPNPFTQVTGATVVSHTDVRIDESSDARMRVLEPGVDLKELVQGLNSLGVGPRDLIAILQAIKSAGALQADLELV